MLFKDRVDAGEKLTQLLLKNRRVLYDRATHVVVSLLRGGAIVGNVVAKKLKIPHLFLAAVKISHPNQPELAIGALCFDKVYLDSQFTSFSDKKTINRQIKNAKIKLSSYLKRIHLKKTSFKNIKNKVVILVDDGIATGATVKVALIFLKSQYPKKIILVVPVAPTDFKNPGFDEIIILHCDPSFSAVLQFYKEFPQVEDKEIFSIY